MFRLIIISKLIYPRPIKLIVVKQIQSRFIGRSELYPAWQNQLNYIFVKMSPCY